MTRPGIVCDELMSTTQLSNPNASVFVPDGSPSGAALARTTHLATGAHPDDIPIMAFQGIAECYRKDDRWFTGVTVTNGSGTPRSGPYSDYSDADMRVNWVHWGSDMDYWLIDDFVKSVAEGLPASVTGEDGMKALELALAAYKSKDTGMPVRLPSG